MVFMEATVITAWAAGEPCDKHDMSFCGSCREAAGIKRRPTGELEFADDCTVKAFAALTETSYVEAAGILAGYGWRPGRGASPREVRTALQSVGFDMDVVDMDLAGAVAASRCGRRFYVSGRRPGKGHAWAIVDGRQINAWSAGFRYNVFEVVA